jgi:hypothetical protein
VRRIDHWTRCTVRFRLQTLRRDIGRWPLLREYRTLARKDSTLPPVDDILGHARRIRDRLEHFDEYEERFGLSVFATYDELGDDSLHVDDMRLDLALAVRASKELGNACLQALEETCTRLIGLQPSA